MSDISQLLVGTKALLLVALVAGIGVIILGEFQLNEETTPSVTNESVNFTANNTWYTLSGNNTLANWISLNNASVSIANTTLTIAYAQQGGNFSVDTSIGRVRITPNGRLDFINTTTGRLYNVSYNYTIGSAARTTFGEGILGVQEITGWLDIIGLAIVMSIVMYFVMNTLWQRRPEQRY